MPIPDFDALMTELSGILDGLKVPIPGSADAQEVERIQKAHQALMEEKDGQLKAFIEKVKALPKPRQPKMPRMPVMPMFPLGTVLLPGMVLPLHVFEPRYQQLVRDCLDAPPHEFGVVLIDRGSEVGGGDTRCDVGVIARIVQVAPLDSFVPQSPPPVPGNVPPRHPKPVPIGPPSPSMVASLPPSFLTVNV